MGKLVNTEVQDALLERIADADLMVVLSAEPGTYDEATDDFLLASVAMDPGHGNDYTIGDGGAGERVLATVQKTGIEVDATDDATHIALVEVGSPGVVLAVTTCASEAVEMGNTITVPSWTVTVGAAT